VADAARIVFTPSGRRGEFARGTTVLAAARALGVDLDSVCGGRGICGRCQVTLAEGDFAKHGIKSRAASLSAKGEVEAAYARRRPLGAERRLGCSARLEGDAVVDVPPESQVHRQVVRKGVEAIAIELDPAIRLHYVEVREPDLAAPSSDLDRLKEALAREWNLKDLDCELHVVRGLQPVLRKGQWRVTVAVHDERAIVAVWPGFRDRAFGLAVDVGSTTIAAHLCDLASGEVVASVGAMNPQIRFGEDLMSRVSYIMMHPGSAGELTAAVRGAINELAAAAAGQAGVATDDILDAVLVGNPVMHHLLLGIDPVELGGAPFALAVGEALDLRASEIGMSFNPGARAYVLPCIAGHVGADAAAMLLAERPDLSEAMTALVDVGTNAEIVLGNRRRLLACSSPTGPAFEGAQVSCGQRAAPGAIERVRVDRATLEPRFKVIGCELWSDDPGFAAAAKKFGVTGICGSGIIEALAEMFLAGVLRADGTIDGAAAARSPRIRPDGATFAYTIHDGAIPIRVTQNDVRAIQLAKAALYAGIQLLVDRMGIAGVERIRLAGAFGSHIDVKYAMILGMLPDCALDAVGSAGNAAGTGARVALLDRRSRRAIEALVRRVEKIETAVEPRFQSHFVDAMAIPHRSAAYPNLRRAVAMPQAAAGETRPRRQGRRRLQVANMGQTEGGNER
jgi:uncharacterized 2Fe-2S/4Fe-4S cluster protein (DUF4445 family)